MPSPLPLEKQIEKRIRDLLTSDYSALDPDQRFEAIKMGVAWIKATKKGGDDAFGSFFNQPDEGNDP
jgi:hypothetical protein